jgi:hypothetical protein
MIIKFSDDLMNMYIYCNNRYDYQVSKIIEKYFSNHAFIIYSIDHLRIEFDVSMFEIVNLSQFQTLINNCSNELLEIKITHEEGVNV